jgi:hypothetical protein
MAAISVQGAQVGAVNVGTTPLCCGSPAPEIMPSCTTDDKGNVTHRVYCASCDKDLFNLTWSDYDAQEIYREEQIAWDSTYGHEASEALHAQA